MTTSERLLATAYHEAGHAVIAWLLGVRFRRAAVTIIPDRDSKGRVKHHSTLKRLRPDVDDSDRIRLGIEKTAMIAIAGEAAQRRFRPMSRRTWHAAQDYHNVSELLSRVLHPKELAPYLKFLQIRVNLMLDRPGAWQAVEAVAEALVRQRTLSADEAAQVIRCAYALRLNAKLRTFHAFPEDDDEH